MVCAKAPDLLQRVTPPSQLAAFSYATLLIMSNPLMIVLLIYLMLLLFIRDAWIVQDEQVPASRSSA